MVEVVVRHAAHDRVAISQPRQERQVLAEEGPRHGRRDRAELPAHLERSVGLGVPHLELTLPSIGVDDHDRPGAAETRERALRPSSGAPS
jgi:hypothetical protein